MSQYLAFPLASGTDQVIVEVTESDRGNMPVSRSPEQPTMAARTFEQALEGVKPIIAAIVTKIGDVSDRLSEVEVEFGLSFNARSSLYIVSGGVEANFKVKLKFPRA